MSGTDDRLRQGLRGYAAAIAASRPAPPVSMVWLRAERRRRRAAVERAERPLRVMQAVGLVCAAAAAGWLLVASGLDRASLGMPMLALTIAAPILAAGGCWAMVAASRQ
jgi:hypothetical protein